MSQLYKIACSNCGSIFLGHRDDLRQSLCPKCSSSMKIYVKYHDPHMPKIKIDSKGDWIDLVVVDVLKFDRSPLPSFRVRDDTWELFEGDKLLLNLGVSIQLPKGYEAHLLPRSSTYLKYGFIMTNSMGIIDGAYCGDKDIWYMPVKCDKHILLKKYVAVAQFRIVKKQNLTEENIIEVENLRNRDRGGLGSTGERGLTGKSSFDWEELDVASYWNELDVICPKCGWEGKWKERVEGELAWFCPKCNAILSLKDDVL